LALQPRRPAPPDSTRAGYSGCSTMPHSSPRVSLPGGVTPITSKRLLSSAACRRGAASGAAGAIGLERHRRHFFGRGQLLSRRRPQGAAGTRKIGAPDRAGVCDRNRDRHPQSAAAASTRLTCPRKVAGKEQSESASQGANRLRNTPRGFCVRAGAAPRTILSAERKQQAFTTIVRQRAASLLAGSETFSMVQRDGSCCGAFVG
jgi:hypothetical protein